MKRKLWLLLLLIPVVLGILGCLWMQDKTVSTGYYLRCVDGSNLFIHNGSPISVSGNVSFDGLDSGDKILLIHGLIAETFPGQARAHFCMKLEDGDPTNIDPELLYQLLELGWQPDINVPATMPEHEWQNDTPALPGNEADDQSVVIWEVGRIIDIPTSTHIETCPAFPDNDQ